jgi:hypothetical protein
MNDCNPKALNRPPGETDDEQARRYEPPSVEATPIRMITRAGSLTGDSGDSGSFGSQL